MQCSLEVQVLLQRGKSRRSSGSSWVTIWQRPVLFCDDSARIRQLQVGMQLNSRFLIVLSLSQHQQAVASCMRKMILG